MHEKKVKMHYFACLTEYLLHCEATFCRLPPVRDNSQMLIQPSQADVRRFFCGVYAKARTDAPLEPMEMLVSQWIDEHPEYHTALSDVDAALREMAKADPNAENPFLHLSMHLSISEQCSIDQPRGIRQAVELLTHKLNSLHDAHHRAMECLGRMVYESQRSGRMPDGQAYIDCVQRHATRD
jgi:Domain of unknown function (DUF1841)